MATITLYKEKVNGVGGLIDNFIKSSSNLDVQLGTLKNTLQGVDSSTCNLQDTVDSISSSSKSEKSKIEDLKKLNNKLSEFIETASRKDSAAEEEIKKSKEDFYTKYSYLKPECEKSVIEHICDGVQSAAEWCKEHWKFIATVVLVAVAVVLLCTGVGSGLGAAIIAGACWGAILGAVIGGVAGGINSAIKGGSFFDGFESGAFDGAVGGAIGGAITGGLTFVAGPALSMVGSIGRGAGIGALSNGVSNMCVTTIDYLAEHGNLNGALDDIAISGFSGVLSGGIIGGISGRLQFKINDFHSGLENTNNKNFVDSMSPEDASRYDDFWKNNGIGSEKTWNEYKNANPENSIDDYLKLVKEQSPWPDGYNSEENILILKEGDTFNMVLDEQQSVREPGGFALKEDIPNVDFARNDMAIKGSWKTDCGKVATYRIRPGVELNVRQGPIGPQIDLEANKYLPGNSNLTQYELFKGLTGNRMDYIEFVSLKRIK